MSWWSNLWTDLVDFDGNDDRQTALLERLVAIQAGQASGDAATAIDTALTPVFWAYSSAPPDDGPNADTGMYGVPAGKSVVDFDKGRLQHPEYGTLDEFQKFSDIDNELSSFRAATIYVDVPVQARLDADDWLTLAPGLTQIEAQKFARVELQADHPYRFAVLGSTRRQPALDRFGGDLRRVADTGADAQQDSYTPLAWTTPETQEREGDYATHTTDVVRLGGHEPAYVAVENTSDGATAIDVEVRGRSDPSERLKQVAEATGIAQNDHHVFDLNRPLYEIDVRYRNNVNGDTVSAHGELYGRP